VADVPLGSPGTLYTRLGDWVGWLGLLGYVAFMVLQSMTERQRKNAAQAGPASS
jgi:apolipoprotein N-acyltransferase